MGFAYKFDFSPEKVLADLGLDEGGRVQQVIDSTILTVCDPYIPFLEGGLKDSGYQNTVIGSGEIVWDRDNKARRLYWGEDEWNWNEGEKQGGLRGPRWVERAMEAGGKEAVLKAAREELKK